MSVLALEPHNDDVALFAAFSAMRHQADVVTVLESRIQDVPSRVREAESQAAMEVLGCRWRQWPYPDDRPLWWEVEEALRAYDERVGPELVLAPEPEEGAHRHHVKVGELARQVFGERMRGYLTYTPAGKSVGGVRVEPGTGMVARKLRALACYESQSDLESCRPHFLRGLDEYLAGP